MTLMRYFAVFFLVLLLASCATVNTEQMKKTADIHYKMGEIHLVNKNYVDAMKELTIAIEKYPDEPTYYNAIAIAYGARHFNDDAIKFFLKAIELDPEFSEAYLNLGALYIELRRFDDSIEVSRMAVKNVFYQTPELAYNNIGWALLNKGDLDGALKEFIKAADLNTRYVMPFYNMGIVYERMGRAEDAARSYRAATRRSPKFVAPYMDLGFLLSRGDDSAGAIEAFEKVIELEPDSIAAEKAKEQLELLR